MSPVLMEDPAPPGCPDGPKVWARPCGWAGPRACTSPETRA
jgi:hypothetical protein